jgi:hypothetical protein
MGCSTGKNPNVGIFALENKQHEHAFTNQNKDV